MKEDEVGTYHILIFNKEKISPMLGVYHNRGQ